MQVNGAFHGIARVIKAYNISVYGIGCSSDEANKAMIKKKTQTCVFDPRPGPRIVGGNISPTRPAGPAGSGRARAQAENLNSSA